MSADFGRDVYCILGLPFDALDLEASVRRVTEAATGRHKCFVSTPNLNFLVACQTDAAFRDSVIRSDLSIADGMPIVWLARLLGIPIRARVAGSTLFESLRSRRSPQLRVYFFGGPDGVAQAASRRLNEERGGLSCVGSHSPGFGSIEEMSSREMIDQINASAADFLVVALGARKGQEWIEHNIDRLEIPVVSHLGAVLNFVAGTVRRAPPTVQHLGLEWLWRIVQEPALKSRYLADGIALLRLIATRALPGALLLRLSRPARATFDVASVELEAHGSAHTLKLAGAWGNENLDRLRPHFERLVDCPGDVLIDLSELSFADLAVVGKILLLYGSLARTNRRLACSPASSAAQRLLRYSGAGFLLAKT